MTGRSRPAGRPPAPAPTPPRRFRSLASRLVALGIGQLLLLALTAIVVFIAEGPHEAADPEDTLTPPAVANLERLVDTPAALTDALDQLRGARVEVSLYDEAHQLIASNVDPPLAIPTKSLHHGHHAPPPDRAAPDLAPITPPTRPRGLSRRTSTNTPPGRPGRGDRRTATGGSSDAIAWSCRFTPTACTACSSPAASMAHRPASPDRC